MITIVVGVNPATTFEASQDTAFTILGVKVPHEAQCLEGEVADAVCSSLGTISFCYFTVGLDRV